MSFAGDIDKGAVAGTAVVDASADLAAIKHPDCAAVIWHRQTGGGFQSWLDALGPEHLPKGRIVLRPKALRDALVQLCDMAQTPQGAERAQLIDDIAALADLFADITQAPYLRVRLDAVTTNACRKFHIDALTARLICTYRGTGTQYGISQNGTDPARVLTVPTGSPVVLRGTLWPEEPRAGLVHRSPPIEGTDETRLVLVLDPVAGPEDAI